MILELRIAPDPILSTRAKEVVNVDDDIRQLLRDMVETMYAHDGAGLAANQVGILKRVIVVDIARSNEKSQLLKLINPVFTHKSEEMLEHDDGCLSVPGVWYTHPRPKYVTVEYLDENGKACAMQAEGLLAYALQHEVDHLDGILFIEYLSSLKRGMIIKKLVKEKKRQSSRG